MGIATKKIYHLTGLSTDTKEIPADISTGSTFLETDTGITYVYNKTMNSWMISKNVEVPAIDAPCRGILAIDLTSRSGLVDTYTIKYTNGSETTFEVVNGAYVNVNPGISKPVVNNKIYTLDINTIKYNLYKATTINSGGLHHDVKTGITYLITDIIKNTTFWPRKDEGKFILKMQNSDEEYVFSFTGEKEDGHDIWQAMAVNENEELVRYVGHFEYTDPENIKTSDYYFIAKPQLISFESLQKAIDEEVVRAKKEELEILEALSEVDTALANEIVRATEAEAEEYNRATGAEELLDSRMTNWDKLLDELHRRIVLEETNSFLSLQELETRIRQVKETIICGLAKKADLFNEEQTIVSGKLKTNEFESYFGSKESLKANDYIGGKITTSFDEETQQTTMSVAANANLALTSVNNIAINADNTTISATDLKTVAKTTTELIEAEKCTVADTVNVVAKLVVTGTSNIVGKIEQTGGIETDTLNAAVKITAPAADLTNISSVKVEVSDDLVAKQVDANAVFVTGILQSDAPSNFTKKTTVTADLVTHDVIPEETATYDLGKTGKKYRDLYLSGDIKIPSDDINDYVISLPKTTDVLVARQEFTDTNNAAADALNAEILRATTAEELLTTNLNAEIERAKAREDIIEIERKSATDIINSVIPWERASATNQLADREFVNSSIATNTANCVGNVLVTSLLHNGTPLTTAASTADVAEALTDNEAKDPKFDNVDNNDYVIVGYPDDHASDPNAVPEYKKFERYKYSDKQATWLFEYELNHSSFTAEQWAAINSGIASDLTNKVKDIYDEHIVTSVVDIINAPDDNDKHYPATSYLEDRLVAYNTVVVEPEINTAINNLVDSNLTITVEEWADINNALSY